MSSNLGGFGGGYRKGERFDFVLIVVLFILLVIVGSYYGWGY